MRVKNVKVVRGADVSSDHYLLLMKMCMRCKVQNAKKAENVAIQTDWLMEREMRMKFQARELLEKKNEQEVSREEGIQETGVSVEDVWSSLRRV